jgi:hypothetical protein
MGKRLAALAAMLIVIAGLTVPASAREETGCTVEARGALPSGDAFHGDAAGNSVVTGNWFHVSPSAGAALVRVTLEDVICTLNGSTIATLNGTARWGNQPVQFFLDLQDAGPPPAIDSYRLFIFTPEAEEIYRVDEFVSRGDINIVAP